MRFWRKKQTWKVIAALLFAVWILMGDRKINVKAELFHILSILAYNLEAAQAFNFKKRT